MGADAHRREGRAELLCPLVMATETEVLALGLSSGSLLHRSVPTVGMDSERGCTTYMMPWTPGTASFWAQQQLPFLLESRDLLSPPNQLREEALPPCLQMEQTRLRGTVTCPGHKVREEVVRSPCSYPLSL